ncbi:MAG: hypothetical protein H0V66_02985 [Bdellovibrionales bacterium]|nr:hypothetical protein [Bdellovibrionales bacterium]
MKFLAALLLLVSMGSEANECARDAKKFCGGTEPGKGQLAKCLGDYQAQLSPACAKELKDFKAKTGKKNPCFEDLAEFCEDIPTDNRKLEYCLLKNENRLGSSCSADFKKKKPNIIVKDVCAQDIVNTCYTTLSEPEAATTRCLIKNRVKLSGFCQKMVDKKITEMKKGNPCFDETEKYCQTQTQFVDIHMCMEKKLNVLTPACKKVVQDEINKEKANPCYMDLRKHCKVGLTAADQHRCLGLNEKELSNSCRQFRIVESDKIKKMVDLCENDRLKLCPKAPFQNGMILKCLKENILKVTPACKALL